MPKNAPKHKTSSGKRSSSAKAEDHSTKRARPTEDETIVDLGASLRILALINGTLDAAALELGDDATREMVLTLLIVYKKSMGLSEKRLVQRYAAWSAERISPDLKESVREALAELVRKGLLETSPTDASNGHLSAIRTTRLGDKRVRAIRKVINFELDEVKRALRRKTRRKFEKAIRSSLP